MSFTVIIPARSASTRLPGKPLLDIGGLPMVIRTAQQAAKSVATRVIIATDSTDIANVAKQFNFQAVITSPDHLTGTDRLSEVVQALELDDDQIVVNVQGDEPFIEPELIDSVASLLKSSNKADIATCATAISDADTFFNPNVVKVVCDDESQALYFSRAPIPWARDALSKQSNILAEGIPAWQHIGLYAYRCSFLRVFPKLSVGQLERYESLEQLRAMEHGFAIYVHFAPNTPAKGIDTPADLREARLKFESS